MTNPAKPILVKTYLDAATHAVLGPEFQRAEPAHVFWPMKHPPHHCFLLVDSHRVARQHYAL